MSWKEKKKQHIYLHILLKISKFAKFFQNIKINMPQDKSTHKFSELQNKLSSEQLKSSTIFHTLKSFRLSVNFSEFNHLKSQGYAFNLVLSLLIWMTLQSKRTVNSSLSELSDFGFNLKKDVYYRLKNSTTKRTDF